MIRPAIVLLYSAAALAAPAESPRPETIKQVLASGLTIRVDSTWAQPGGVVVATVRARKALGPASFALEGHRAPIHPGPGGLRALVPVPLTMPAGAATLGLEIRGRRGKRRIPVTVTIAPRTFTPHALTVPEAKRSLLERPERVRDSRLVLEGIRTESTTAYAHGPLRPPVAASEEGPFGGLETYEGTTLVPLLTDGIYGDQRRGLDYALPVGTPVKAPGAGIVVLAQPLTFAGQTVLIDHGRGVVSALFHLSRIDVTVGQTIEAGASVGLSGDSGVAAAPGLRWGVYVHGVAVDPHVLQAIDLG